MGVRVTQLMLERTALSDLNRARRQLSQTLEQATSGLRINRPSDDPVGVRVAAVLRADLEETSQLERNITQALARLTDGEESLRESMDVLLRARELAIQGANDGLDAESRRLVASEVEALHDQMLALSNQRSGGAYVFSGYASDTPAFSVSGPFVGGTPPPSVTFTGDPSEIEVEIDRDVRLATTLDGRRTFLGDADGDGAPDAGREDVFALLGDLWQALQNNDRLAVGDTIDRIDQAQEQLQVERSRLGARLTRTEAAREALGRRELGLTTRLSQVQDADSVEVFSQLTQRETLLQASLQATASLFEHSLLDFLR